MALGPALEYFCSRVYNDRMSEPSPASEFKVEQQDAAFHLLH